MPARQIDFYFKITKKRENDKTKTATGAEEKV
jgi:hypothetical protein